MKNDALEIFRVKATLALSQWSDRMKVFIVENQAIGLSKEAIKKMRSNPESKWAGKQADLAKELKKAAAGLVNRVHMQAYRKGITG
jgi:hypothetical protein